MEKWALLFEATHHFILQIIGGCVVGQFFAIKMKKTAIFLLIIVMSWPTYFCYHKVMEILK